MAPSRIKSCVQPDRVADCETFAAALGRIVGTDLSLDEGIAVYQVLTRFDVVFEGSRIGTGPTDFFSSLEIGAILASLSSDPERDCRWWKVRCTTQTADPQTYARVLGQIVDSSAAHCKYGPRRRPPGDGAAFRPS